MLLDWRKLNCRCHTYWTEWNITYIVGSCVVTLGSSSFCPEFVIVFNCVVLWDWVHLVCQPLLRPLYQPRIMNECETIGGMRTGRRNVHQCRFIHHKSQMTWPGNEHGKTRQEEGRITARTSACYLLELQGEYSKYHSLLCWWICREMGRRCVRGGLAERWKFIPQESSAKYTPVVGPLLVVSPRCHAQPSPMTNLTKCLDKNCERLNCLK
jgi:hypothetical protein